jgi:hypothetical protein
MRFPASKRMDEVAGRSPADDRRSLECASARWQDHSDDGGGEAR